MKNLLLSTAKYVLLSNTENVLLTNKCHYCKYEKSIFVLKHKICSFQIQKNILISDTNVTYFSNKRHAIRDTHRISRQKTRTVSVIVCHYCIMYSLW